MHTFGCTAVAVCAVFLVSSLMQPASAKPKKGSGWIVVQHPEKLLIFNSFEQRIPADERIRLLPFTPMKVLRRDDTLSDQFTKAFRVTVNGIEYFLVCARNGSLTGASLAGTIEQFNRSETIGDTIEVTADAGVEIRSPDQKKTVRILKSDLLIRHFQEKGKIFVSLCGSRAVNGWLFIRDKVPQRWYRNAKKTPALIPNSKAVASIVKKQMTAWNDRVRKLYDILNRSTGKKVPPPQWRRIENRNGVILSLDPPFLHTSVSGSIDRFVLLLEAELVGTGVQVARHLSVVEVTVQ